MFFEFIVNFSILFCFTVLIFWPFIHYAHKPFVINYKPIIVGLAFGLAALVLTTLTSPFANGVLINSRNIFLIFSGFLGGPISIFITGFIIVISRELLFFTSTLSLIMMFNMLLVTFATVYVAYKRPITYQNLPIYFFILTFEHVFVLLIYYNCSMKGIHYLIIYVFFSTITFYAIREILSQLESIHTQIKQIYEIRKMDFLTQLPNNIAVEKKLSSYINAKTPFELLHINIKHFQDVNLLHTYQKGDEILIQVGQLLKQQLPDNAFIGRIGSDEFYVILPKIVPAESIMIAFDLNQSICNLMEDKPTDIQLSLAIGISSYPANASKLEQLYQYTNRALNEAKLQEDTSICHYNQLK